MGLLKKPSYGAVGIKGVKPFIIAIEIDLIFSIIIRIRNNWGRSDVAG